MCNDLKGRFQQSLPAAWLLPCLALLYVSCPGIPAAYLHNLLLLWPLLACTPASQILYRINVL